VRGELDGLAAGADAVLSAAGSSERVDGPSAPGASDGSLRVPGPDAGGGSEIRRVHSLT
jgi:hypothetical protein